MACILSCSYYPTSQNTIPGQNNTKVAATGERLLTKQQWLADLGFTIFVGDPTGCPSNLFSNNTTAGFLPNSNYRLYVATRQTDNSWSSNRDFFPPDISASFNSADYFNGEDPALDIILQGKAVPMDILVMNEGVDNGFKPYNEIIRRNPCRTGYGPDFNLGWRL